MDAFSSWTIWRKATPPGAFLGPVFVRPFCQGAAKDVQTFLPFLPSATAWGWRILAKLTQRNGSISFRHTWFLHGPCSMSSEELPCIFSSVLCKKWTITVLSSFSLSPSHTSTSNKSRRKYSCQNRGFQQST